MDQIRTASSTAWRRIAEDIAASIDRGDHAAGTVLPPATETAARYGVHRHTVRQAYRHLQDIGLVSIERGRGTLVTASRFPYRLGRQVSFRENFRQTGLPVSGEIIRAYLTRAPTDIASRLRVPAEAAVWRIRTLNSAGDSPISTAVHYVDARRFPDFGPALATANASITAAFRLLGVQTYLRGSTTITARVAGDNESELLDLPSGSPVLCSLGVDTEPDGTPLHVVETSFAADRVEFLIEPD